MSTIYSLQDDEVVIPQEKLMLITYEEHWTKNMSMWTLYKYGIFRFRSFRGIKNQWEHNSNCKTF
jgi:hypothetical protein